MFMHCFGSFLLQAMFLSLQVFAFKGQSMKLTVMLSTWILRYSYKYDIHDKNVLLYLQTVLITAGPGVTT